jgi:hypothetical protein
VIAVLVVSRCFFFVDLRKLKSFWLVGFARSNCDDKTLFLEH